MTCCILFWLMLLASKACYFRSLSNAVSRLKIYFYVFLKISALVLLLKKAYWAFLLHDFCLLLVSPHCGLFFQSVCAKISSEFQTKLQWARKVYAAAAE
jgi:hypothetical protein